MLLGKHLSRDFRFIDVLTDSITDTWDYVAVGSGVFNSNCQKEQYNKLAITMLKKLRELLKDTVIYGISGSIGKAIGFFLVPIYTRIFSPEEYGIIEIISTTLGFLEVIVVFNLNSALARYFYELEEENRSKLVSTLLYVILSAVVICTFFDILFAKNISHLLSLKKETISVLYVAFVLLFFRVLFSFFQLILRMERSAIKFSIVQIPYILISTILAIYLVVFLDFGIIGFFWAQLAATIFMLMFQLYFCRNYISLSFSGNILKRALKYSLPMLPTIFSNWVSAASNRYFTLAYIGLQEVGFLSLGAKIATSIALLTTAFGTAWGPFALSLIGDVDQKRVYAKTLTYYAICFLGIASILAIFSKDLVLLLSTHQYENAYKVVGLLAGATAVTGVSGLLMLGIVLSEKTYYHGIGGVVRLVVVLLFSVVLGKKYGLIGLVTATFLGSLPMNIIGYYAGRKHYPIPFQMIKILALLFSFVFILIASLVILEWESTVLVWGSKIFLLIFYCSVVFLYVVERNEVLKIKQLLVAKLKWQRT